MDDWDKLVALRPELYAYARSVADSAADAEDLVSDALERARRASETPEDPTALKRWLFRIVRNLSIDELRKRRVRREYRDGFRRLTDEGGASQGGPEDGLLVRMALESLKAQHREVLVLVDVLGMSYREAGEVMDVPHGTVMSRVSRARRALLDAIEPAEVVRLGKDRDR